MNTFKDILQINSFYILNSCCKLIIPKKDIENNNVFLESPVDVDYSVKEHNGGRSFKVYTEIKINHHDKSPGYAIEVEAIGEFSFKDDVSVTPQQRQHFIYYIAVGKCIDYIRGFLASLTAHYPLGKYLFHDIDMEEIYARKIEQLKKIKTSDSKIQRNFIKNTK